MKIILAQRFPQVLMAVAEALSKKCPANANEILYTSRPWDVVDFVDDKKPVIVVSGQVFDIGMDGASLARQVKGVNPHALFYVYSTMPEKNRFVDGIIPKEYGSAPTGLHPNLVQIFSSDLEGVTAASMREKFPQIR